MSYLNLLMGVSSGSVVSASIFNIPELYLIAAFGSMVGMGVILFDMYYK